MRGRVKSALMYNDLFVSLFQSLHDGGEKTKRHSRGENVFCLVYRFTSTFAPSII